jgi:hypothetical protein
MTNLCDTNALKFVFLAKKRVSVTSVTASLETQRAKALGRSSLGCGLGRAVSLSLCGLWPKIAIDCLSRQ